MGAVRQRPEVLAAVQKAYAASVAWCRANPLECDQLVAQYVDLLTPEAVADALPHSQLEAVPVAAARSEIDFFYQQLLAQNPSLLGGKLPDAGLFGG